MARWAGLGFAQYTANVILQLVEVHRTGYRQQAGQQPNVFDCA